MPSSALEQLSVFGPILGGLLMIIGGFDLIDLASTREAETPTMRRLLTTRGRYGLVAVGYVLVIAGVVLPFVRGGFERTLSFFGLAHDGWAVPSAAAFVIVSVIASSAFAASAVRRIGRRRYRSNVLDAIARAAVASDLELLDARIVEWLGERRELDLEALLASVLRASGRDEAKARAVMGEIVERTFAAQEADRKAQERASAEVSQLSKSFAGGKVVLIAGYEEWLTPFIALERGARVVVAVRGAYIEVRRSRSRSARLDRAAIVRVIRDAGEDIRRSSGCWMVTRDIVQWLPRTDESSSSVKPADLAMAAVAVVEPLRSRGRALVRLLRERSRNQA